MLQANKIYNFRMIQAQNMKWLDLTFNSSACQMFIYSRDGVYLNEIPRPTDHIVMAAANR